MSSYNHVQLRTLDKICDFRPSLNALSFPLFLTCVSLSLSPVTSVSQYALIGRGIERKNTREFSSLMSINT